MQYAITTIGYRVVGDTFTSSELVSGETLVSVLPAAFLTAVALADTKASVTAERDRRANLGFTYNGVTYQSDQASRDAIDRNAMLAFVAITNGAAAGNLRWSDPNADFYWIAADNSHVTMDAQTVVALAQASAAFSTNLTLKASALKALNPIPTDYTADTYWS